MIGRLLTVIRDDIRVRIPLGVAVGLAFAYHNHVGATGFSPGSSGGQASQPGQTQSAGIAPQAGGTSQPSSPPIAQPQQAVQPIAATAQPQQAPAPVQTFKFPQGVSAGAEQQSGAIIEGSDAPTLR